VSVVKKKTTFKRVVSRVENLMFLFVLVLYSDQIFFALLTHKVPPIV